jgi:hypothetical protein
MKNTRTHTHACTRAHEHGCHEGALREAARATIVCFLVRTCPRDCHQGRGGGGGGGPRGWGQVIGKVTRVARVQYPGRQIKMLLLATFHSPRGSKLKYLYWWLVAKLLKVCGAG